MTEKHPKATHQGTLNASNTSIDCFVLDDGRRVILRRSMAKAIGLKRTGSNALIETTNTKSIGPEVDDDLRDKISNPIIFNNLTGVRSQGFEADILVDICKAVLKARDQGSLTKSQVFLATQASVLLHAFAKVGVIALVDEATGYQDFRVKDALARILEKFIAEEYRAWTKTFPDDFYREIFRLKGWPWDPKSVKRPSVIGHYTNDIIYDRLAPGALEELRRINPPTEKGHRKQKHHQWLTGKVGNPTLKSIIDGSMALMRAAPNWRKFKEMLNRSYPKYGDNIALALEFDEDNENK
ncbi:MAG: hypothetical protein HOC20_13695 [Chloroflexi bacterium]|jgi:hypothetical protein|nr:hypothetical protein [Chloroflexota bacterium]